MKPYSVLLLYPEEDNVGGIETFWHHCEAEDVDAAAQETKMAAIEMNDWGASKQSDGVAFYEPDDFVVLLVIEGHHMDLWDPEGLLDAPT